MASKRSASNQLNHDNWDVEDKAEVAGSFSLATPEQMESRVIKKARRRGNVAGVESGGSKSLFSGFTGFSSSPKTDVASFGSISSNTPALFDFLKKPDENKKSTFGTSIFGNKADKSNDNNKSSNIFGSSDKVSNETASPSLTPTVDGSKGSPALSTSNDVTTATTTSEKVATNTLPPLSSMSSSSNKWTCDVCMVPNDNAKTECVCCSSPKPGSSSVMKSNVSTNGNTNTELASAASSPFRPSNSEGENAGFKFGQSTMNATASAFKFGQSTTTPTASGFKFGTSSTTASSSTSSNASPFFSFGTQNTSEKEINDTPKGFALGGKREAKQLGVDKSEANKVKDSGFTFGTSTIPQKTGLSDVSKSPSSGFTFGTSTIPPKTGVGDVSKSPSSGFTFGTSAISQKTSVSDVSKSPSSGFTFGSSEAKKDKNSFSFRSPEVKTDSPIFSSTDTVTKKTDGQSLNLLTTEEKKTKNPSFSFNSTETNTSTNQNLKFGIFESKKPNTDLRSSASNEKEWSNDHCATSEGKKESLTLGHSSSTSKSNNIGAHTKHVNASKEGVENLEEVYSSTFCSHLRTLNRQFSEWIAKQSSRAEPVRLSPIFKDYEKHFEALVNKYHHKEKTNNIESNAASNTNNVKFNGGESRPLLGAFFGNKDASKSEQEEKEDDEQSKATSFSFGNQANSSLFSKPFAFTSENKQTSNLSSVNESIAPSSSGFSFTFSKSSEDTNQTKSTNDDDKNEEPSDEPPKVEVNQVQEEEAFYSVRCKLFYKKDANFVDKGVGMLHLKNVENSKTQLLVRAETNLGNVLLNVLVNDKMNLVERKNNLQFVCVPNPPIKGLPDGPVSMLLRVKTAEIAEQLANKIKEALKSKE